MFKHNELQNELFFFGGGGGHDWSRFFLKSRHITHMKVLKKI